MGWPGSTNIEEHGTDPSASEGHDILSGTFNLQPDSERLHDTDALREQVDAALVRHVFQQYAPAAIITILLAAAVVAVLYGYASTTRLLGWVTAIVLITGARLWLQNAFQHSATNAHHVWVRRYLALAGVSALLWGLSAPLFVPQIPANQELVLIIAIAGLAAGALPINAALVHVYVVYLAALLAPVVITYLAEGDRTGIVLGVMATLYGVSLGAAGSTFARELRQNHELSIRLGDANRELERLASHDALTTLWNRRRFEDALDEEFDRVRRYGSRCTALMIDIDHFKKINDTCGHEVGDRVLIQLAQILQGQIRNPDQAARWGGEEFMVMLPEATVDMGLATAERLRQAIADSPIDEAEPVTVSIGVTDYQPPESRASLLKRLDDALYRAKRNGRNRVEAGIADSTD